MQISASAIYHGDNSLVTGSGVMMFQYIFIFIIVGMY